MQVVEPNLADFHQKDDDIRLAFNAVAAVDALAAHMFWWCQGNAPHEVSKFKDDTHYRDHLASLNYDFGLVRDIAKVQKHVRLNRGAPQVAGADKVETRSLGWGVAKWGEGRWGGPPQVVVEVNGGFRVVSAVLERAKAFLESEMARLGVT